MNARLLKTWDDLHSSYWFIPTLMAIAAVGLSFLTTALDERAGADWIRNLPWLHGNQPDGARALLSTVAGSMIGVAGVTFSITIASVVYASGQYGPRLLSNFMQDTGNQVTLGTFIATFLYCLLVLRTVRSADEAPAGQLPDTDLLGAFVPHIAVLTAIGLALASIAVFIFFIHHIPESIYVSNVIAGVGRQLGERVETLFPDRIGYAEGADADEDVRTELPEAFFEEAAAVKAPDTGYLQSLDADALLEQACAHDLILRLKYRPGDFVSRDELLLLAWPPERLDDAVSHRLCRAFAWGRHRTALQDVRFLINELVEIAARALSPGVNDPFTAIACLDWLGSALKQLADRRTPSALRYDAEGALRVIAEPTTFEEFCALAFGQLRQYVAADRNAALHMLKVIGEVGGRVTRPARCAALQAEADRLLASSEEALPNETDRALLRERHGVVACVLSNQRPYEAVASEHPWLGGSA